jgi:hypothetical protein
MTARRRNLKNPEPLSAVLSKSSPDRAAPRAAPIPPQVWRNAVGARIADRTRPLRLDGRQLTVQAATAVWVQELTFLAPAILERLTAAGFHVDAIRFRVGPIDPPLRAAKPALRRTVPSPAPLSLGLSREIAKIDDPALRQAIAKAAATNLAWQRAVAENVSEARPAVRAPRSAEPKTAPRDRALPPSRATKPRKP